MAKKIEIEDYVFSKNDGEFECKIIALKNGKVTLEYSDNYTETKDIDVNEIRDWDGNYWQMDNWTVYFEQLEDEEDED